MVFDETTSSMCRAILIIAIVIVLGVLVWIFFSVPVIVWDGGFDLKAHVKCTEHPMCAIYCEVCGNREDAEYVLKYYPFSEHSNFSTCLAPFDEQPLTVFVPLSGRVSGWLGREIERYQFQYLVVIGDFQDGQRIGKIVEIPDCRVSKEVSVSFP